MKRKYLYGTLVVSVAVTFLFFMFLSQDVDSAENGCIKCHTDESLLKSLYKPKKIDAAEGEG
ncbi:MAG: hypothetical protein N2745_05320 [Syntrophorhabdaceae bacterium]|nr:hypothetical protein [Syntrophorhabdaceae bacterium]